MLGVGSQIPVPKKKLGITLHAFFAYGELDGGVEQDPVSSPRRGRPREASAPPKERQNGDGFICPQNFASRQLMQVAFHQTAITNFS